MLAESAGRQAVDAARDALKLASRNQSTERHRGQAPLSQFTRAQQRSTPREREYGLFECGIWPHPESTLQKLGICQ